MSMCSFFDLTSLIVVGMASSGSMMRPPCANQEDMLHKWENASLDKVNEKDVKIPACWCGDVCKVKVSTDRKKSWMEGRRYLVCPNYAFDRALPTHAYDQQPSSPPLCKYITWIDHEVPEDVQKDQYQDCLRRQCLFKERFQRGLEEERRQKERMERKQREEERARQAKLAHEEKRARKLAKARKAQEEDEARDKKGKWSRMTQ
ncbi:hypothetical protein VPH35_009870 [Triticum aestivum]